MTVNLSPSLTHRRYSWTNWKGVQELKKGLVQFEDDGSTYLIWFYDGPEIHLCSMWTGTVPNEVLPEYTQEQNDADKAEFEADFKGDANKALAPHAVDGRLDVHHTIVNRLQNLNVRAFSFYTARSGSLHNINTVTGESFNDIAYMMFDESDALITDPTLSGSAVKTVVDFEPHYDYEIIGGYGDLPKSLRDGTTDQWYIGGVGVPDLPPEMYGSIPYISEVNIEAVQTSRIITDGRATSFLPYKYAGYPTNKIRFYIKHPPGAQQRFQLYLELFN